MTDNSPHIPVMLEEVLATLAPKSGEVIVDGTFGAGGYSKAFLDKGANVIAFDRDPTAIKNAYQHENLTLIHSKFSECEQHITDKIDGFVLDLGVSSMQFDEGERGFSFRFDAPLDMGMGLNERSAFHLVNETEETPLANLIYLYGEERASRQIAREIVKARLVKPIETTFELVACITKVLPNRPHLIHPATRTFQALRIAVNEELQEVTKALEAAERLLKPNGRLVIVSFHSLEDRIVKDFFVKRFGKEQGSRHLPATVAPTATFSAITKGALKCSQEEADRNPRARSAKLRAGLRLGGENA